MPLSTWGERSLCTCEKCGDDFDGYGDFCQVCFETLPADEQEAARQRAASQQESEVHWAGRWQKRGWFKEG